MPTVLRVGPYRFQIFGSDMNEPPHVHVIRDRRKAKFWLVPGVALESNQGFAAPELNVIERLVVEHRDYLLRRWNEFFNA
jgi:hypothetical protein